jgi:TonB family protein
MKKKWSTFALGFILLSCAHSTLAQASFNPAEVSSAGDVQFPVGSVASGIVVVDVSLNSKGDVTSTSILRGIASLTPVATSSVEAWKYRPASVGGTPQASLLRVAFAFRPRVIMASPPVFEPMLKGDVTMDAKSGYIPPGVLGVSYAAYPIDAATVGAVVAMVEVGADGKVGDVKLIRSYNPFNRFSLEAAKKWQFRPATFRGEPVASIIVIAFVNSPPIISN